MGGMKKGVVYILTNKPKGVLYIGVTSGFEHRLNLYSSHQPTSFVSRYKLDKLVLFEEYDAIAEAIAREKQLKRWHRDWKINLIEQNNPNWNNLLLDTETSSA